MTLFVNPKASPRRSALLSAALLASFSLLSSCSPQEKAATQTEPPAQQSSPEAASVPASTPAQEEAAAPIKPGSTLRVISHDSFNLSEGMLQEFEQQYGVKVERIEAGDAGEMLSRLILTKKAPIADVVYGLDNAALSRAHQEDLLTPYVSPTSANVPVSDRLDEGGLLNTVDYGIVALNYDRAAWGKTGLPLPTTLAELAKPEYASKMVIPNPSTSSPGLAFLLATVNELGEEGAWKWWKEAKAGGLKLTGGWSDAYYTEFTRAGGKYPIVLSYASSPAAEIFYADDFDPEKLPEQAPTANLFIPGTTFLQLEGAGIIKGGENDPAARAFIDWLLSPEVQKDIPTNMWVYPAVEGTPLPPVFDLAEKVDVPPAKPEVMSDPQAILDAWVDNVQRQ